MNIVVNQREVSKAVNVNIGTVIESVESGAYYLIIGDRPHFDSLMADKICVLNLARNEVQHINRDTEVYTYSESHLVLGEKDIM